MNSDMAVHNTDEAKALVSVGRLIFITSKYVSNKISIM